MRAPCVERDVDDLVVEVVDEAAAEVVAQARGGAAVEHLCRATYGIGPKTSAAGPSARSGSMAAAPASRSPHQQPRMRDRLLADQLRRHERLGRCGHDRGQHRGLVGRVGRPVAERRQHLLAPLEREQQQPAEDGRHRVERELEARHDPEVAAAAAQPPEQLGPLGLARRATTSPSAVTTSAPTRLSQDSPYLRCSQPMPPPSVSPATPVRRDQPTGGREPVRGRGRVEVGPGRAGLRPWPSGGRRRPRLRASTRGR